MGTPPGATPSDTTEIFSTNLSVGRLKKLVICLRGDEQGLEFYAVVDKRKADSPAPELISVHVTDQQADVILKLVRGPQ